MNTSERLKRIMEVKGFNLKTFAEQADIPYRTLQNYILSGREPNAEALMKLHTRLGINLNWLVSGDGQMFNSKLEVSDLSQGEMNLINNYQTMSEDIKTAFNILFN
ncbi:helix-turn-helix domain-containing protein, partial [Rodentibacter pneumotropicus]|uniref:helix-turn-helix domain-containing protein n=2 Tax=Rodentibacter pneumotropicus TaxID=758 RepID=UPI0009D6046D